VQNVATQVRKGKQRRTKYGYIQSGDWKKATVELHPDDKIELF
jgi:ribosomal protein L23